MKNLKWKHVAEKIGNALVKKMAKVKSLKNFPGSLFDFLYICIVLADDVYE